MKILIISPCHENFGGWFRASNITKSLEHKGIEVEFIFNSRNFRNPIKRILVGLGNAWKTITSNADIIHIFEFVLPETFFACLAAKLFRKHYIVDWGDEWETPITYGKVGSPRYHYLRFLHKHCIGLNRYYTATSDFLVSRLGLLSCGSSEIKKVINGVNLEEFVPMSRQEARKLLGLSNDLHLLLSFGNTMGGERQNLLDQVFEEVNRLDKEVRFLSGKYLDKHDLPIYLGAADIIVFPTGEHPCEKACFPIRVGTILNAERIIATDEGDTEFHKTIFPFDCVIHYKDINKLAFHIVYTLHDTDRFHKLEINVQNAKYALSWDKLTIPLIEYYEQVRTN